MDWDTYFLDLADAVRAKSKDPSTQVGVVITRPTHEIVSTGFNGFPRGIGETQTERWERPIKYEYVCHAEVNALLNAARIGVSTQGCTLYMVGMGPPTFPCTNCAKAIIQAGIQKVIASAYKPVTNGWSDDFEFSRALLEEAGISHIEVVDHSRRN